MHSAQVQPFPQYLEHHLVRNLAPFSSQLKLWLQLIDELPLAVSNKLQVQNSQCRLLSLAKQMPR